MLEAIELGDAEWPYGEEWETRMRRWAKRCGRLIVLSDNQVHRAEGLLGIDAERCVQVSNGFDPELFQPLPVDRAAHWRRHLVDEPQGWRPGEEAGSVGYRAEDLKAFAGGPTLLYVGRFTAVKRVGLLIEAYARARLEFDHPAPLVIVGGYPGEWEREHPADTIERTGAEDVFLAGWHGHDELPGFLNASDVVVLPSVREQFGQVLVEGMACGLPAIAVDAHGPAEIVDQGETGWLVEPDDLEGLTAALVDAVNRPDERRRRGENAREVALERYSWPALAEEVAAVYEAARAARVGQFVQLSILTPPEPLLPFALRLRAPARAPGAPVCTSPRDRPSRSVCTTPAMSTTPAASPWSPDSTVTRPTRRCSAPCSRSRTSSTAAPRAPTRTPATAPGCCSSSPTSCCVESSRPTSRRPGSTGSRSASCPRTTSAAPSSRSC